LWIARRDPVLRGLLLGAVLFSILVAPVQELAPAIARRYGDGATERSAGPRCGRVGSRGLTR
jgi:hypothetical protein